MITNIVAVVSICLVTNVTEHFPTHTEGHSTRGPNGEWYANWITEQVPDTDPTNKIVQTDIVERTTLQFDWEGQQWTETNDVVKLTTKQAFELGWTSTTNEPVLDKTPWNGLMGTIVCSTNTAIFYNSIQVGDVATNNLFIHEWTN